MRSNIVAALMAGGSVLAATPALAERGAGGHLNILYWQAPSILNPYMSASSKDTDPTALILDPLANFDAEGRLVPTLAVEIPTVENGGVSADLTSITWKLRPGVLWSDGTPLTSADVLFTAEYCLDAATGCAAADKFANIASVEALDDLTIKITFTKPRPNPYTAFVSAYTPVLQAAQFAACKGAAAVSCTAQNFGPIGTGPYIIEEFRPNDVGTYKVNPTYRDAAKPAFATVTLKGGGDAMGAARAVLQTGEFDYAWNVQIAPNVMDSFVAEGKGVAITAFGPTVESLRFQLTDPSPDLGDKRATLEGGPHPILSDIRVRKALALVIDRDLINEVGYGAAGQPSCNVLAAPPIYASMANDSCLKIDIEGAQALLDEAGWVPGADGIREKDGQRLTLVFQTSTNAVRQDTQAMIKQAWTDLGVDTQLRNIEAGVYFGNDPASPDTYRKFFADVEMYSSGNTGGDPENHMKGWTCDDIPAPATGFAGNNVSRFCRADYDALWAELSATANLDDRARIAKSLNDMIIQDYAAVPLVHRGLVSVKSVALENLEANDWDSALSAIEDWTRKP
ncbi:MAG: peptide ABC transporter substrate-binding protein [Gemmobacter sp.]|nr:peptide ABC transporter substrate-binding protein [Gemmobacter sp.]